DRHRVDLPDRARSGGYRQARDHLRTVHEIAMTTLLAPTSRVQRTTVSALRAGHVLDDEVYCSIRRRMVLDYCKWDPQVGDVSTIGGFPILLSRPAWDELAAAAEEATTETLQ